MSKHSFGGVLIHSGRCRHEIICSNGPARKLLNLDERLKAWLPFSAHPPENRRGLDTDRRRKVGWTDLMFSKKLRQGHYRLLPKKQTGVKFFFAYLGLAQFSPKWQTYRMDRPNRIKDWIKRRGSTLEKLSEQTGISVTSLSKMASGKTGLEFCNAVKIAQALDITTNDLVKVSGIAPEFTYRERRTIAATLEAVHLQIKIFLQMPAMDLEGIIAAAIVQPQSEAPHQRRSPEARSTPLISPKESKKLDC